MQRPECLERFENHQCERALPDISFLFHGLSYGKAILRHISLWDCNRDRGFPGVETADAGLTGTFLTGFGSFRTLRHDPRTTRVGPRGSPDQRRWPRWRRGSGREKEEDPIVK